MKVGSKLVIGTIIAACTAAGVMLLVPPPDSWAQSSAAFHQDLLPNTFMMVMHIGAALLFLSSLYVFKAGLRRAYIMISAAAVLIALGSVQVPLMDAFGLTDSWWSKSGLVAVPFVAGGLFIYLGTRSLSKLVGIQTLLTRAVLIFPVVTLLSIAVALLPHATPPDVEEIAITMTIAIITWATLLDAAAFYMITRVVRHIGSHYTHAMAWLAVALFTILSIYLMSVIQFLFLGEVKGPIAEVMDVAIFVSGFIWLRAGYAFARTREY